MRVPRSTAALRQRKRIGGGSGGPAGGSRVDFGEPAPLSDFHHIADLEEDSAEAVSSEQLPGWADRPVVNLQEHAAAVAAAEQRRNQYRMATAPTSAASISDEIFDDSYVHNFMSEYTAEADGSAQTSAWGYMPVASLQEQAAAVAVAEQRRNQHRAVTAPSANTASTPEEAHHPRNPAALAEEKGEEMKEEQSDEAHHPHNPAALAEEKWEETGEEQSDEAHHPHNPAALAEEKGEETEEEQNDEAHHPRNPAVLAEEKGEEMENEQSDEVHHPRDPAVLAEEKGEEMENEQSDEVPHSPEAAATAGPGKRQTIREEAAAMVQKVEESVPDLIDEAVVFVDRKLGDKKRAVCAPMNNDTYRTGCMQDCRCLWYQRCYPHTEQREGNEAGLNIGVCELNLVAMTLVSVLLFVATLVFVLAVRFLLIVSDDEACKQLVKSVRGVSQVRARISVAPPAR